MVEAVPTTGLFYGITIINIIIAFIILAVVANIFHGVLIKHRLGAYCFVKKKNNNKQMEKLKLFSGQYGIFNTSQQRDRSHKIITCT